MIGILSPEAENLAVEFSPLLKAALLTLEYMEVNGPIGLTPSKALKRHFVEWAAEAFAWPKYTAADLYSASIDSDFHRFGNPQLESNSQPVGMRRSVTKQ